MQIHGYGAACTDCLMLLANGETPPEMTEEETEKYLSRVDSSAGEGMYWDVGGEHADDCPNMRDGEWVGNTDCTCEDLGFSWSPCDVCRRPLGGSRHAVHYFSVTRSTYFSVETDTNN